MTAEHVLTSQLSHSSLSFSFWPKNVQRSWGFYLIWAHTIIATLRRSSFLNQQSKIAETRGDYEICEYFSFNNSFLVTCIVLNIKQKTSSNRNCTNFKSYFTNEFKNMPVNYRRLLDSQNSKYYTIGKVNSNKVSSKRVSSNALSSITR